MAYAKILGSAVDTHDNQKNYRDTSDPGPYVAVVKDTQDPLRMGRLGVVIPALSHDGAETGKVKQDQIFTNQYLLDRMSCPPPHLHSPKLVPESNSV